MVRILLTIFILLAFTGCPENASNITPEQIAAYQAQLTEAQTSKSFWQSTASILVGLSLLALMLGIILGTKAKSDADKR